MLSKYHKIISGVISIGILVVAQVFASPFPVFRFLIPAIVACIGAILVYNYFYLKEQGRWNRWKSVQTALFFVAWFGVFLLLPNYVIRGIYLLASMPIIYFVELLLDNFGEQILINQVLLIAFGLFVSSWGVEYYYKLSGSYVFLLEFFAIFLLVRASLEYIPHSYKLKLLSALSIALFMSEVHWALSFWPLHYSALAIVAFCIFYAVWTLYHYALFNVLTTRRIQFYLVFALVAIIIIVSSTPWTILG